MSSDLSWEHQFCLSCDRQTDGATYCSESCRLSEFENSSSTASTPASSPGFGSTVNWTSPKSQAKFYLSPAYNFYTGHGYGSTLQPQTYMPQQSTSPQSFPVLTPSSSHSSLCSLRSTTSNSSNGQQVSEQAKKQLRDYASSFEYARLQRRRSY